HQLLAETLTFAVSHDNLAFTPKYSHQARPGGPGATPADGRGRLTLVSPHRVHPGGTTQQAALREQPGRVECKCHARGGKGARPEGTGQKGNSPRAAPRGLNLPLTLAARPDGRRRGPRRGFRSDQRAAHAVSAVAAQDVYRLVVTPVRLDGHERTAALEFRL